VTWTCRIPANAVLYGLAPSRTGKRGRPRTRGGRLGTAEDLAAAAAWATVTVPGYRRQDIKHVAEVTCLSYGSWHTRAARLILSRGQRTTSGYNLPLITTDLDASPAALVARHATRWAIEQAFAGTRNVLGAGEARNRAQARRRAHRPVRPARAHPHHHLVRPPRPRRPLWL
jgi:hypothetical protein